MHSQLCTKRRKVVQLLEKHIALITEWREMPLLTGCDGDGYGDGYGNGSGYGDGDGYGNGSGDGSGYGSGDGSGSGNGNG